MAATGLTAKQAAFVREYLVDRNGAAAARRAGYSERSANVKAATLMRHPLVKEAIGLASAEVAEAQKITLELLFARLETSYNLASTKANAAAMIQAVTAMAKLAGLWVEKSEDLVKRQEFDRIQGERHELQTAGELLASAAESLGLPRDATPAQIVGALSERPIATPEAFRLLHAAAQVKDDRGLL